MASELLFEVGTEEIPARMAAPAAEALRTQFSEACQAAGLPPGEVLAWSTPRRLTLVARGLPARQPDRAEEKLGPAVALAFDAAGAPTKAAQGFARGQGADVGQLEVVHTPKGDYVAVRRVVAGRAAADVLPELLTRGLATLPFPKSMRWGDEPTPFVRPIHWILALLDGSVLDVQYAGVRSGKTSRGHRFLAPAPFEVAGVTDYLTKLRAAHVMLDPAERRATIAEALRHLAAEAGGTAVDDPELLGTVTHLVEWPTATLGHFDAAYLAVPEEILVSAMRNHQKYFAWRDAAGRLRPCFTVVANTPAADMGPITRGNERVLRGRLDDARFFFKSDREKPLADFVAGLGGRTFLKPLGSMHDKVQRLIRLGEALAARLAPEAAALTARAALLCKADLGTAVVGEFPELQGIIGRAYADLDGEPAGVGLAIDEHYRPRFSGDALPTSAAGALLALADKADSIVGCFGVGLVPTGAQDPYALRRQALGIIHILCDRGWLVPLSDILALAADGYAGVVQTARDEWLAKLLEFFRGRLRVLLAADYPADIVDAVLEVSADRPADAIARVRALATIKALPDFEPLAVAFKRVVNITRGQAAQPFDAARCVQAEETALFEGSCAVAADVERLVAARDFEGALRAIVSLKPVVDRFFDAVLVMDPNRPDLQANRLGLLQAVGATFRALADFSRLQVEKHA